MPCPIVRQNPPVTSALRATSIWNAKSLETSRLNASIANGGTAIIIKTHLHYPEYGKLPNTNNLRLQAPRVHTSQRTTTAFSTTACQLFSQDPDILDIELAKGISHTITLTNSDSLNAGHNPIIIHINEQYACNPLAPTPHIDWDALSYYLGEAQILDHFPQNANYLNILTKTLTKTITAGLSKATTLKTNKNQNRFSLPPKIKTLIKSRNKLKRRAKQFADSELNKQANRISKQIKIQINSLKNEKWSEFLENIPTGDTDAWKVSRALKGTTKTYFPPIHGERGLVYTDEEKAEAFADYLERQFSPNMSQTDDPHFEEEERTPPNSPAIPPVTLPELKAQISALKTRKNAGPDQISNKALKLLPENLLNQLLTLINASITLRTFPTLWKTASVILIPKPSKNKTFPQNWRPISLSKITEKLLSRLFDLISELQLIPREQFGFMQKHDWSETWKIQINPDKTQTLLITDKQITYKIPRLTLNGSPLEYVKTIKYLGTTIDPKLNFNAHIATALKKAHRTTACLYPLLNQKSTLSLKNKILIYKQVIRSQICYAAPILSQTSKSAIRKLQRF
ncbi:hypothetical protein D910_04876 [Dendroctonus ponderosae]|uniref:Reverse transcriptase domain-containing protein n=1 Tax=Dendroctonus ponderosae TaxID=77166 RepID=U4U0U7_DENPD|nr:hypothetical protein D910_04876 [Dendroctonus ponderosae]